MYFTLIKNIVNEKENITSYRDYFLSFFYIVYKFKKIKSFFTHPVYKKICFHFLKPVNASCFKYLMVT